MAKLKNRRTTPVNAHLPHVIVQGNPMDGFTFTGPFLGPLSAVEHADNEKLDGEWWVAPLHPAEES